MAISKSQVRADKAARYFQTLCSHFAKKVAVDMTPHGNTVHFPTGTCRIELDGTTIRFFCEANDLTQLEMVERIVAGHVTNFKDLRGTRVTWRRSE